MDTALNPNNYPTYNIGDKVTIRQWDDMESEFGLDEHGNINVPKVFTEPMKQYWDRYFPLFMYAAMHLQILILIISTVVLRFFLLLCLNNPNLNAFRPLLFPLILFSKVVISFDSRNNRSFLPHHPS